jgi:hypothetical protein
LIIAPLKLPQRRDPRVPLPAPHLIKNVRCPASRNVLMLVLGALLLACIGIPAAIYLFAQMPRKFSAMCVGWDAVNKALHLY